MSANRRYPFGYAMKDGKIRIVPEEAEVVEKMRHLSVSHLAQGTNLSGTGRNVPHIIA